MAARKSKSKSQPSSRSKRPTLRTRKPIDALVALDFVAFPIWEYASDEEGVEGQDETWVRPLPAMTVAKGCYSLWVAADFTTASGAEILGAVSVTTAGEVEFGDGILLPDGQYIVVATYENRSMRNNIAARLNSKARDVFPLSFELRVLIGREKEHRTGTVGDLLIL
ncbi:MAG TPA: hypothetical protein VJR89_05300 [Polyangiales bacterium]|nr:hypothetical protein [Polyangiales bacterium]